MNLPPHVFLCSFLTRTYSINSNGIDMLLSTSDKDDPLYNIIFTHYSHKIYTYMTPRRTAITNIACNMTHMMLDMTPIIMNGHTIL